MENWDMRIMLKLINAHIAKRIALIMYVNVIRKKVCVREFESCTRDKYKVIFKKASYTVFGNIYI